MELMLVILGYVILSLGAILAAYQLYKQFKMITTFTFLPLERRIVSIIMIVLSICLILFVLLFGIYIIMG